MSVLNLILDVCKGGSVSLFSLHTDYILLCAAHFFCKVVHFHFPITLVSIWFVGEILVLALL